MKGPAVPREVSALVATASAAMLLVVGLSADGIGSAAHDEPGRLAVVMAITVALQSLSLTGFASSISVAGIGMLTAGFLLGTGAAALAGILAAFVHALKKRPRPYKVAFNAATFALGGAAGTAAYRAIASPSGHGIRELAAAEVAAAAFVAVNIGLLTVAMAAAERGRPLRVWRERLAWLTPHYLAFGPLAFAATVAARDVGTGGLAAAVVLPLLLAVLVRASLGRARARARHGALGAS